MDTFWFQKAKSIILKENQRRHGRGEPLLYVGAQDFFHPLISSYQNIDPKEQDLVRKLLLHAFLSSSRFYPNKQWKEQVPLMAWLDACIDNNLPMFALLMCLLLRSEDRRSITNALYESCDQAWQRWESACLRRQSQALHVTHAQAFSWRLALLEVGVYQHSMVSMDHCFDGWLATDVSGWPQADQAAWPGVQLRIARLKQHRNDARSSYDEKRKSATLSADDLMLPLHFVIYLDAWLDKPFVWAKWMGRGVHLSQAGKRLSDGLLAQWEAVWEDPIWPDPKSKASDAFSFDDFMAVLDGRILAMVSWLEGELDALIAMHDKPRHVVLRFCLKKWSKAWQALRYRYTVAYQGYAADRVL